MNERKIIDRKCFRDLAKEVGLTTFCLLYTSDAADE